MKRKLLYAIALGAVLLVLSLSAIATPPPVVRGNPEHVDVYGFPIITAQERADYKAKLDAAKTPAERAKVEKEYRDLIAERNKEWGVIDQDKFNL